jgi:hypothetical protein
MPTAPNHSGNLPRVFERCPNCQKKGFYRYGGTVLPSPNGYGGLSPGRRCKYCHHRLPDMTPDQYRAHLNHARPAVKVIPEPGTITRALVSAKASFEGGHHDVAARIQTAALRDYTGHPRLSWHALMMMLSGRMSVRKYDRAIAATRAHLL